MKNKNNFIIFLLLFFLLSLFLFNCASPNREEDPLKINSFHEIPGITEEEISAIEAFQAQEKSFIYGTLTSTETFYNMDSELSGFTALFCQWLTDFFELTFEPKIFEWDELISGLESGKIDFTGELTATPKRREAYLMTDAIANRYVSYYRIDSTKTISEIAQTRKLRLAFFPGTTTFDDVFEHKKGDFISFFVDNYDEAYNLLLSGEIDAFIEEHTAEAAFSHYGNVVAETFFPLLFGPVSLASQKHENAAIISVVQKYLKNGGIRYLVDLYNQGESEYTRNKLFLQLTEEEKLYIKNNSVIKFVAEHDNYPISFFNTYDNEFQGIAFDVIKEIEKFTGLTFELVNNQYDDWAVILKMLEDGKASFITELVHIPEREERFLWPEASLLTDYHALLSKEEYRDVKLNEIMYTRVGLVEGYAQTELFNKWFPNHAYTVVYDSFTQAFDALGKEIDMVMGSQNQLSVVTIFYENPGYKANIVFDYPYSSTFGFNKSEAILCSIIDKSLRMIDIKGIDKKWTSKTYDYRIQIARMRIPWIISVTILVFCVLVLAFYLYFRSKWFLRIKEESESKSIFLANMSHEIRTPMNAITGMTEMLLRGNLSNEMRRYAQDIKHAGNNLISIINDILDISKIEAGKLEIIPVNYMLSSLINDTVNIIRARLTEKQIWFNTKIDENIPNNLIGDDIRLRQIILNLLSNAVKYTDKGGVTFYIGIEKQDNKQVFLRIEVTDTGKGIKSEDQIKLFSNFVQVDKQKNVGIEGTGLGLAITKRLVDAMGGSISLQSEYGEGSTFTVLIPQDIASPEPLGRFEIIEKNYDENIFTVKQTFSGARMLIVDDLYVNLKVAEGLLEPYKAKIDTCLSGEEAIELVKKNEYDIVFMDHMMPGIDGIEATMRIREFNKQVPIIALTANAVAGMKEKFIGNGFNDFISKPVNVSKLDEVVVRWLNPDNNEQVTEKREKENSSLLIRNDNGNSFKQMNVQKKKLFPVKSLLLSGGRKRHMLYLFIFSFVIMLTVTFIANFLIAFSLRTMEYNIEQRLKTVAEKLAGSVSAEELEQYREIEDMELPSYQALRVKLFEFSEELDLLYAYFMYPYEGALYYIVDNDFDEETRVGLDSPTDHILDEIPWLMPVLDGVTVYSGLGTYTYGWDGLITAYAPVFDHNGRVTAVAGVDIEDTEIVKARQLLSFLSVIEIIMVVVVFLTGMIALIRFRKEANAAKKANEIKDTFLAKMSHELLSPMNAIIGINELILRSDISGEIREHAKDIKKAGEDLTSIINSVLNLSENDVKRLDGLVIRNDTNIKLPYIPGIDVKAGLASTGGIEKYKKVLEVFCENIQDRLFLLQTVPNESNLPVFIIHIHSIKGSSATIGAMEISALALELEEAGRAGDFALIEKKLPVFVEQINELLYNISKNIDF